MLSFNVFTCLDNVLTHLFQYGQHFCLVWGMFVLLMAAEQHVAIRMNGSDQISKDVFIPSINL